MPAVGARLQRLLGLADARGTGAHDHRYPPGAIARDGLVHCRLDLRQGQLQQGIVAAAQGQRPLLQRGQRMVDFTEHQLFPGQHPLIPLQTAGMPGKQRGSNLFPATAQRTDNADIIQMHISHGTSPASRTCDWISS